MRFIVRDALATQDTDLISASDYRKRNRWQIIDTADNSIYDEFNSKQAATGTAKDINAGLYGPLAV